MISPDTRSLALEALEQWLDRLREQAAERPDYYAKYPDVRGDLHRRTLASRIREVRAAIRELDGLRLERAA